MANHNRIDFMIMDPDYKLVETFRSKTEGMFEFYAEKQGQYTFVFSNMGDNYNSKDVVLAIHSGKQDNLETEEISQEISEMAQKSGLEEGDIRNMTMSAIRATAEIDNLSTLSNMKLTTKAIINKLATKNNNNFFYMNIVECISFLAICAFNLYYVKSILNDRRII